ncbi:MAG: endonuclease/exonuclease/phosphatase family protein [Hyphomicrobiaceae bacterium]|nr:endonuclease/exonuclease/phosphatase family protein [Hyphomicrobiaceae bacterium]
MGVEAGRGLPAAGGRRPVRMLALSLLVASNLSLALIIFPASPALADAAAPLTGHIIGVGIAAAAALLLRRHGLAALVGGAVATFAIHLWLGLGAATFSPGSEAIAAETRPSQTSLSIVSINTWDAAQNLEELRAYLATGPADIVVLSELGPDKQGLVPALSAVYPHQRSCAHRYDCSLALLSRVPFEAAGTVAYTREMPAFVWARFAGALHVIGTHVYRPSRKPWLHARQTEAIARMIKRIEGPVVLAGDLNMSPWSHAYKSLRAQTGLKSARWLMPSWPAWPLNLPQVALDHILVSHDLTVTASGTGPAVGSDHLPVLARVERQVQRTRGPTTGRGSRLAVTRLHLDAELFADLGGEHGGARDLRR